MFPAGGIRLIVYLSIAIAIAIEACVLAIGVTYRYAGPR